MKVWEKVLYRLKDLLAVTPAFPIYDEDESAKEVVYKYEPKRDEFTVYNEGNGVYRVEGEKVFRLLANVNFDDDDSIMYFGRALRNMKVDDALRAKGCQDGDYVYIKDFGFEFVDED